MREIQPVHMHDSGAEVANLHDGLLYLIRHEPGLHENNVKAFELQLKPDRNAGTYGRATTDIVGIFQYQIKNRPDDQADADNSKFRNLPMLPPEAGKGNGDVDELTAKALNWLLRKRGGLP